MSVHLKLQAEVATQDEVKVAIEELIASGARRVYPEREYVEPANYSGFAGHSWVFFGCVQFGAVELIVTTPKVPYSKPPNHVEPES